jgi:hypothetical protein
VVVEPVAAPEVLLREHVVLEQRPGTYGPEILQTPMLELSSEGLKRASNEQLDEILMTYLGITPRSFWSRQQKQQIILNCAVRIEDSE